ncbi:HDOD domain-containing protein [Desulfobacter postgatei]|jgi:HD-like signal output (HDOD) protein|uniref:HDOD domain-containing protein n=1 Tax=Desulfobacter postgatei TaxID=2293 RepID=UPI002A35F6C9|nr:HDOD domain-containing protein [Desulfobacter postgatei]MDX9964161.1 HDOD domain-containing protein [Desulfobacter postgatei]
MSNLQIVIKEIKNLKPIPAVVTSLLEIIDDPNASMKDITKIIQYDPAITADILRTANSAYFGLKRPAETIQEAAMMLGTNHVVDLVMLKLCSQAVKGTQKGYDLHEGALWKYSVSSALIAKQVAVQLDLPNKNSIFTASLLKDIGKTVLDKFIQDAFEKISNLVINENFSFMEAEKQIIGVDHAELGGMIAKMWKFSPRMVGIIRNHHLSSETMVRDKDLAVVYLSDCICMMMGMGVGADGLAYRFHRQAMDHIGISAEDTLKIIADFACRMEEVEMLLKVA